MTEPEGPAPKKETWQKTDNDCSQAFTTEPKTRRHLYGLTATRKRAALLMELLFQNGFVGMAPYRDVKTFIEKNAWFIGMDPQERTLTGYIGRPAVNLDSSQLPETHVTITYEKTGTKVPKTYKAWKKLPEKLGLCHKLGWMKFEYRVKDAEYDEDDVLRKLRIPIVRPFIILDHSEVPLPYHLEQKPLLGTEKSEALSEIGRMGTSKSEVCVEGSIDDLCACPIEVRSSESRGPKEPTEIERRERRVSKQHTQICSNLESENIPSTTIFSQKLFLNPAEQAAIEERDRKRLDILDRNCHST